VLTGGDPLKRPDLFTIVDAAVQARMAVAVAPSVTPLLTPRAIHRLGAAGVGRIALSLDGPSPETHDRLRGVAGSFEATLAAIGAARAGGVALQINTSLTPQTVPWLAATASMVAAIEPVLWSVFFVVPVGRATSAQQLQADACENAFHALYDWRQTTRLAVKTTAAPAFRRVVLQRDAGRARSGAPRGPRPAAVNDGKGFVFVSHTGEVYPSGFLPLSAGNVRETPLATLYRSSLLFRHLRDESRLEGKCGVCPFRGVCGGSRARAYATTGNPFAADPACAYEPERAVARA
jgi:radical SAM protein with 4Fe4S-binding SPASM domain